MTVLNPDGFKHGTDDWEAKIEKIMDYQEEQLEKNNGDKSKVGTVLLILDDILGATTKKGSAIFFSKTLKRLFTMGRHYSINFILLVQGLVALPSLMKTNSKVIGMFKSCNHFERKYVVDHMLAIRQGADERKNGYKYLNTVFNEPYNMLIVCQFKVQTSNKLTDYCFKWKADILSQNCFLKRLKLGKKCFWNCNTK